MTIKLKNDKQIAQMRVAGHLAAEVLAMIRDYVPPPSLMPPRHTADAFLIMLAPV